MALCRVFTRLIVVGALTKSQKNSINEVTVIEWLKERLNEYGDQLFNMLSSEVTQRSSAAITLLMRLVKEQALHLDRSEEAIWRDGLFSKIIQSIVDGAVTSNTKFEFVDRYMQKYADVRYYTVVYLA